MALKKYDLNKYCKQLVQEFEWAKKLNSMARQSGAERAFNQSFDWSIFPQMNVETFYRTSLQRGLFLAPYGWSR